MGFPAQYEARSIGDEIALDAAMADEHDQL
jgi:hypothetical protein